MNFTLEEKNHFKEINIFFIEDKELLSVFPSKEEGLEFKITKGKHSFKMKFCPCGCITANIYTMNKDSYYYNNCPICNNKKFKKIITPLNHSNDFSFNLHNNYKFTKKDNRIILGEKVISKLQLEINNINEKVNNLKLKILNDKEKNTSINIHLEGEDSSKFYVINANKRKNDLSSFISYHWSDEVLLDFLNIYNEIFYRTDLYIPIIPRIDKYAYIKMINDYEYKIINEYFKTDIANIILRKKTSIINKELKNDENKKRNIQSLLDIPKSILKEIVKYSDRVITIGTKNEIVNHCVTIADSFKDLPPENVIKLIQLYRDNRGVGLNFIREFRYLLDNGHKFNQLLYYIYNTKEKQNIVFIGNIINYYYDYVRMSNEISVPYTKYPKNLIKVHDVRAKDFDALLNAEKDKQFIEVYKEYEYLNKEKIVDEYIFLSPENINSLVFEGQKLNHCVSSYASSVINKKSIIFFMRKKMKKKEPLVTIEINLETKEVVQARGSYNRRLNNEENQVLNKWIKKNSK